MNMGCLGVGIFDVNVGRVDSKLSSLDAIDDIS